MEEGDIVFSAEGTVGKCVLFTNIKENWITNIHGIILRNKKYDAVLAAYTSCILRFYKEWGYFGHFTVGGQGGSLGKRYWNEISIPLFPLELQISIGNLYHNNFKIKRFNNINEFISVDKLWNVNAGILEIFNSVRKIKKIIERIIDLIVKEKPFKIEDIINELYYIYK